MQVIEGLTMGTSYCIRVARDDTSIALDFNQLRGDIQTLLNQLDKEIFSTWEPASELSRFNRAPALEKIPVSADLFSLTLMALRVYRLSQGAFDPTVASLVDLWGFGPGGADRRIPAAEEIARGQALQGLDHLEIDEDQKTLSKRRQLSLDYSAIAKGYAVDRVAALLEARGLRSYLVEIGGELLVQGEKSPGEEWRIGLEAPQIQPQVAGHAIGNAGGRLAIAASGDYLNYFEEGGRRYSHEIDPATGWPSCNDVVSLTVLHDSTACADALATALMVMGPERALAFSIREKVPVYMILRTHEGYKARCSEAFARHLR